jgi:phosphatidylserine/phosphatidylglycerophosphate/cardiolipin synthase-like enzyme
MDTAQIDNILRKTLDDHRLSRGEKRLVRDLLGELGRSEQNLAFVRHRAFELARHEMAGPQSHAIVTWLEEVVKLLVPEPPAALPASEAAFSPGDDCAKKIVHRLRSVQREVDICVFTITDDRISEAILEVHGRGAKVRIIADDDKSTDRGSDIDLLRHRGIPTRVDQSPFHMHHKFAVFDRRCVLTGSYNWTRSAAKNNEENFIVTFDPQLVRDFSAAFERLWKELE